MLKRLKKIGVTVILTGMAVIGLSFVSVLPAQAGDATIIRLLNALAEQATDPMPEKQVREKHKEAGPDIILQYAST
jgi:hypothetical protein